jgi:predicted house-cleaning noncanonical NTP pyrophosphatase (MazG superfamily)
MEVMKKFACHKMIRGNDTAWMAQHGITAQTHPIPVEQKEAFLKKKLIEEAAEVTSAPTHAKSLSELIDVQEALWSLLAQWQLTPENFEKMCAQKRALRGSYAQGVLLTSVTMSQDHAHLDHYNAHPEKFIPIA